MSSSQKPSYSIRFRGRVKDISIKHEIFTAFDLRDRCLSVISEDTSAHRYVSGAREISTAFSAANPQNLLAARPDFFADTKTKKRTYEDTFGTRAYDQERYGQEIAADFFQQNVGHAVIG